MNAVVNYLIENEKAVKKYIGINIKRLNDTDDVYQSAVEMALRYPVKDIDEAGIGAMSYRVVNNTAKNFYNREPDALLIGDIEAEEAGNGRTTEPYTFEQLYEYQADLARDPMEIMMEEQEDDEVKELINTVPNEKHREFLRWYLVARASQEKAAEYVGMTYGAARKTVQRFKEAHGL